MSGKILVTYASRTGWTEGVAAEVATFTVCMTLAMRNGEKYRQGVVEWLGPVRRLAKPVSEGIFAGGLGTPSANGRRSSCP